MAGRREMLAAVLLVGAVVGLASRAGAADLPVETQTFKKVGDRELKVRIAKPADAKPGDTRPAIVFFHGGG